MGQRQRRRSARARFWQQPATLAQWATVAGVLVAIAALLVQVLGDDGAETKPSPTATADPSSLPTPKLVQHTVMGNTLRGVGTTDPLPDDYTVYLQARRIDTNKANVSDPASIDEKWNWTASVELPSGDYAVSAVLGPTSQRASDEFVELTGHQPDGPARFTVPEIRRALAEPSRWTDRYASDAVTVTVPRAR